MAITGEPDAAAHLSKARGVTQISETAIIATRGPFVVNVMR